MTEKMTHGPLNHIRVLDLAGEQGQLCGKYLADLGADVIKVEPPQGDPTRLRGPFFHDEPDKEKSLPWLGSNTNKRSITLDVESQVGQRILKELVRKVDLVIESFAPGYLASLGLGYEDLAAENPRIVMTSITPFGQMGPYASDKASDLTLVAMSGFMSTCGDADRPPVRISVEQSYTSAGVQAATASLLALRSSSRTNRGQHVDVSIRECLPSGGFESYFWDFDGSIGQRLGVRRRRANIYIRDLWPCKDGYIGWRLMVAMLGAPTAYSLVAWMDEEGMAGDLKDVQWETVDMTQLTQEQMEHWESIIIPFFQTHTKTEIYEVAVRKGMLMSPAYNVMELLDYPQLSERDFWARVDYPELDTTIAHPGGFCKMSETPLAPPHRAPRIGEHNEQIYRHELEMSDQEIAMLKEQGVI